jgi:hypothetical protein
MSSTCAAAPFAPALFAALAAAAAASAGPSTRSGGSRKRRVGGGAAAGGAGGILIGEGKGEMKIYREINGKPFFQTSNERALGIREKV